MNYFELFELPVSFTIDQDLLNRKYFELQKKYHPDFFTQSTEHEQAEALDYSSLINKALKVFKDKDSTIKYVLQEKGLLEEEEKYQLPPEFLMEMMELNEHLSEDSAADITALEADIYAPVQSIIENYDNGTTPTADLEKVKEYYFKKKYLNRILDRMEG